MTEPKQLHISRTQWLNLVIAMYPKAVSETNGTVGHFVLDGEDVAMYSTIGEYGWIK